MLKDGEKILDLERRGLSLIQDDAGYQFTMDAVLLSDFARAHAKEKVVELGAGSGVISILMSAKNTSRSYTLIEIQERLADMASRSIILNELSDVMCVKNIDMKCAHLELGEHKFDVAVVNPPYMPYDKDVGEASEIDICKREARITLKEVVASAEKLLKYGGKLFVIVKSDRLTDLIHAMREKRIEPKRILPVQPKASKRVDTILVEGKCGAKSGVIIEKPLIVFDKDGEYSRELKRIYNK